MDIDALHSALLSLTLLPEQIRSARQNITTANDGEATAFGEFLNSMERDLRIAKATLARELGFPVCQCCWPPELSVIDADGRVYCAGTGSAVSTDAFSRRPSGKSVPSRAAKPRKVDRFTRAQKEKLFLLRDTLLDSISGGANGNRRFRTNGGEATPFVGDRADAGNDAFERDFAMGLLSQESDALAEIDGALKRIESGTYGVCEKSGKPIPRDRLEAIPFARYTVECQSELEKQKSLSKTGRPAIALLDAPFEDEEEEEEETPARARKTQPSLAARIRTAEAAMDEQMAAG